jgi:hypothetical protein
MSEMQDEVFTDEAAQAAAENDPMPEPPKAKRKKLSATDLVNPSGRLFAPTSDELAAERQRQSDRQVGLLIGPKNLEKLRAFGWDVVTVNANHDPLTPGIAHRGMTE